MKKKITQLRWLVTTFLLVAAMVVPTQAWADIEPSKPSGEGTSTSPYQISTAAELYWFAGLVNGDEKVCTGDVNRNLSACATLTADITVNSGVLKADGTLADDTSSFTEWTPMGDPPNQPYNGTFEGANHTISGLYFNNSTTNHVGLFGGICGTVMNVGVIDSYFKGQSYVGGVCGMIKNYGTITNCYNKGAVSGSNEVGGVCGRNTTSPSYSTATVINCYNIGAVSGYSEVGGVCGNSAPVYDPGQNNAYTYIKNCYNIGTVSGTSSVGGVCGSALFDFQPGTSYYSKIENCYYNTDIYSGYAVGNIVEGGTVCTKVEGKTSAKFRSGEVAYLLFYGNNDGVWGQAIGTESYPVLGGQTVYQFTPTCSSGSENKAYSNTYYQNNIPDHYYINGICSACGGYQPAQKNEEGYYEIDNAGQLFWFAGLVNGDTNVCDYNEETNASGTQQNKAACAVLTANIVVNSGLVDCNTMLGSLEYDTSGNVTNGSNFVAWTPIGFNYQNYIGTFDGKGYTVSGLYFNDTSKEKVGLFGRVDSGGKISNVGVLDSYFQFRMQGGGICGLNYGEINNCTNDGTVIGNSTGSGAGGVCGMNYGTVKDCKNTGSVSGTVSRIGGVCGFFDSGSIENCLNEGTVSGTNDYTGGVCGYAGGGAIKRSYNTASVSGLKGVGGVCGDNGGATLEDCYNTGNVGGSKFVGGVCGDYSSGYTIKNCYNTGAVSGQNNVGGVCGLNSSSTITNCYYLSGTATGGINGADATGSAEVKTQKQFGSGEVCYLLNGSSPYGEWGQQLGTDDYPVHLDYKIIRAAQDGPTGTNYWATFSNRDSNAEIIAPTGGTIKVYNATVSGGTMTLTPRSDSRVKAGEGVLLKANSEYVNAKNIADEVTEAGYDENELRATQKEEEIIDAEYGYRLFHLTYNNSETKDKLGFYLGVATVDGSTYSDGTHLKATPGKAYLMVSTEAATNPATAALARGFAFGDYDDVTGIECITVTDEGTYGNAQDGIFDLTGRKVSNPAQGLYIKNGKKVIIK